MKVIVSSRFALDEKGAPFYHVLTPSDEPQTVKRFVGEAAVKAGSAKEVKSNTNNTVNTRKGD